MPVAAGLMQLKRISDVRPTETIITYFSPILSEIGCGQPLNIEALVTDISEDPVVPVTGGAFQIINKLSNIILYSGNVNSNGTINAIIYSLDGEVSLYIKYLGLVNLYYPSESDVYAFEVDCADVL